MKVDVCADYVVITLRGELDVSNAVTGGRELMAVAASAPGSWMIIDLAEVTFIDCRSLRELASVRAQVRRAGGDLVLAGPQPIVLRLIAATDMMHRCPIFASVPEAVSRAASDPAPRLRGVSR
jgi:anti-sigma B factor antagonist